eukprot:5022166-Prymnesium_polylepis.1
MAQASPLEGFLMPKDRPVRGSSRESDHWVPSDTYALANDFRRQHTPQVPMDVFAELLIRCARPAGRPRWPSPRPRATIIHAQARDR